ncbi:MAG: hypothetical protein WCD70_00515 [Alphaproteobacteria bacterium]
MSIEKKIIGLFTQHAIKVCAAVGIAGSVAGCVVAPDGSPGYYYAPPPAPEYYNPAPPIFIVPHPFFGPRPHYEQHQHFYEPQRPHFSEPSRRDYRFERR